MKDKIMGGQKKKQLDKKKYVRYTESTEMYSMGLSKFQQIAKDAKAIYKVERLVLVNTVIPDEYLETFHLCLKQPLWLLRY